MGAVSVESEAADLNKTNQRDTMRTSSTLLLFGLVAAVHGGLFVQDGQEYEYFTTITSAAGTMDVATHSAGEQYTMKVQLQVKGKKLNMKISDLKRAIFVGGHLPTDNPFETKAKFKSMRPVSRSVVCQVLSNLKRNLYMETARYPT